MAKVYIDDQELEIGDDERLNGIQAAQRVGVEVPHYCWHPGLSVVASCRMCLVESGRCDPESGEVTMMPKLVPACQTPASDGTVFVTNSDKVRDARAMVEEDLLIRHPIDCPICDKAGECHLQDYHFEHGRAERRADIRPFTSRRRPMGETVTLFVDRCVMCSRCVRFTREITGTAELMVVNRGAHEEIDVFPGYPLDNKLSGNVVDLCPVGALGDKDFLYKQRVWFMKSHAGVCAGCSTGCSVNIEENQDHVFRLKPRENPHINQWWMCDDGRYGFKYIHDEQRLTLPAIRREGKAQHVEWPEVCEQLPQSLSEAGKIAVVVSPQLTVEAAYLLCSYVRQQNPDALLALGPIRVEGDDESFPNGFTIRAEKCPNRLGVEAVLQHFQGTVIGFDALLDRLVEDPVGAIWVTGGYPYAWVNDELATRLRAASLLIVQDLFPSPLWRAADYQLPGVAFAERSGSYVNANDHLQSFEWAVRPPAGAMPEGHVYWRLLQRSGLYDAAAVMQEVSREILYFSAAAGGVSELGVNLKVNQLTGSEQGAMA